MFVFREFALPFFSPSLSFSAPFFFPFPLEVGFSQIQLEGLGSAVSSPSWVLGAALTEIKLGAFSLKICHLGATRLFTSESTDQINCMQFKQ